MKIRAWLPAALAANLAFAGEPITVVGDQQEISIPLPAIAADSQLLFELDGYDVAAVSRTEAGRVHIPVAQLALAPGEHYLLILSQDAEGNIDTLSEHRLEVFQRAGVRQSNQSWNVLLAGQYRVAGGPEESLVGEQRDTQNAALRWSGARDNGTWIAEGNLDLLFDSNQSASLDGQRWQLPAVQLRAGRRFTHGEMALAFGDSEVLHSDLVLSSFSRRGLRFEANALEQRLAAQVFTLHADPVTSLDAEIPPFDTNASVTGARASVTPFSKHPDALRLSASWVDGDSALAGAGIAMPEVALADPFLVGGNAWAVALDSFAWERSLWLHGEFAQSRFDGDGLQFGDPVLDDNARRFAAVLSSGGALRTPALEQWSLGVDWQRVGPRFRSLGNLLLPSDLDVTQIHARATWRGLLMDARWLEQNTDVDDQPFTARIDSGQRRLALEYTPVMPDTTGRPWKWLGTPTLGLSYETTHNRQLAADALLAGADLDNRQRNVSALLSFAHEKFSIGLNLDRFHRDDRSAALIVDDFTLYQPPPDSRENVFGVNVSWYPSPRFSLSPQWQRSRVREVQRNTSDTDLWSLQLSAEVIPDVLSLQVGWSDNRDHLRPFELPQDAQRLSSSNGNFDMAYRMKRLTFHLRGAYGRNAFETALGLESERQWRALLSVELNWEQGQ